jgi:hypothetical protein
VQETIPIDSDSESGVDEMILDALGTSTHNARRQHAFSSSPTPEASLDDFYPPEQSPQAAERTAHSVFQSPADKDSTTPCPVRWDGCGLEAPDGDEDPNEVQCEGCRFWSHMACLEKDINWEDRDVRFVCSRCEVNHDDPLGL